MKTKKALWLKVICEQGLADHSSEMWQLRGKKPDNLFSVQWLYRAPPWRSGLAPPVAWGVTLETQDRVPCWASCMEPAFPSACVSASLCVCVSMNK